MAVGPGRWARIFTPRRRNEDSPRGAVPELAGGLARPSVECGRNPSLLGGSCRSSRWLALWGSSHRACWSQGVSSVTWRGGAGVENGTRVQHPVAPPPPAVASHRVAGFPGPRLAAVPLAVGMRSVTPHAECAHRGHGGAPHAPRRSRQDRGHTGAAERGDIDERGGLRHGCPRRRPPARPGPGGGRRRVAGRGGRSPWPGGTGGVGSAGWGGGAQPLTCAHVPRQDGAQQRGGAARRGSTTATQPPARRGRGLQCRRSPPAPTARSKVTSP